MTLLTTPTNIVGYSFELFIGNALVGKIVDPIISGSTVNYYWG